jgi:hypothetical protein
LSARVPVLVTLAGKITNYLFNKNERGFVQHVPVNISLTRSLVLVMRSPRAPPGKLSLFLSRNPTHSYSTYIWGEKEVEREGEEGRGREREGEGGREREGEGGREGSREGEGEGGRERERERKGRRWEGRGRGRGRERGRRERGSV